MSFLAHPDYPQEPPEGECAPVQERSEEEEEERNRVCSEHRCPNLKALCCGGKDRQPHEAEETPFLFSSADGLEPQEEALLLPPRSVGHRLHAPRL
ncbi:hypothetical protein NL676_003935 [Syzygium grande]|nr:hypothetical protein NL676_003935 [Syzygium grande]